MKNIEYIFKIRSYSDTKNFVDLTRWRFRPFAK